MDGVVVVCSQTQFKPENVKHVFKVELIKMLKVEQELIKILKMTQALIKMSIFRNIWQVVI